MGRTSSSSAAGRPAWKRIIRSAAGLLLPCLLGCAAFSPPRVSLDGLADWRFSLGATRLTVRLAVENPNTYPLELLAADGCLIVNDRPVGEWSLEEGRSFPAGETTIMPVEARVDHAALLELLLQLPADGRLEYELRVDYRVGTPLGEKTGEFVQRGEEPLPDWLRGWTP